MAAMRAPNELSAIEASQRIASGELTCEALVRACLDRAEAREGEVGAFSFLDPQLAIDTARRMDQASGPRGPLHGLPVGVKDVLDTDDMPTGMGSPIYAGHRTRNDAAIVAKTRAAGALVLGKTVTCEFAGAAPGGTRNPHDLARTPGGSSSGSAAAVADFMAPLAFGTQTGGSMLRPASFCGIVGYKPTYGTFSRQGLKFAAENLDTIGLFGRTVEDVFFFADALLHRPYAPPAPMTRPRLGLCRTFLWEAKAQPEMRSALEAAARQAEQAGAIVTEFDLPAGFEDLSAARDIVNDFERTRSMTWEWAHHREAISPQLTGAIESGLKIPFETYAAALRRAETLRRELDLLLGDVDGLIAPCVNGEAPVGLHYTGDPALQGLWTILHVPTLALPAARGPANMPIAIQIVAPRDSDRTLFALAAWLRDAAGVHLPQPRKGS